LVSSITRNNMKLSCTDVFCLCKDEMIQLHWGFQLYISRTALRHTCSFRLEISKQNERSARSAGMQ